MPASSFVNRDHAGGAVDTSIVGSITGTSLSITIADATGWPSGGANGPFHVIVSYDLAGKEKIEVQSRTGTTLTIADTGKRGIDGTSAQSHNGTKIRHCYTAIDAQEANDHITNVALDHHTQYLNSTRHAAVVHTAAMLGTDSVGSDEIAAGAVGSSELAAASVIAGKIAVGGISAANQHAAGTTDTAALADLSVTAAKIAADTITAAQVAPDAIGASELANNAVDTAAILDAAITLAKMASEASQTYSPTFTNPTGALSLGTGGTSYGHYFKIGRIVVGWAGFNMAADGNIAAGGVIEVSLPVAMRSVSDGFRGFIAGRSRRTSPVFVASGTGVIPGGSTTAQNITTAGASAEWDATTPFNWGTPGDGAAQLDTVFFYEAAS